MTIGSVINKHGLIGCFSWNLWILSKLNFNSNQSFLPATMSLSPWGTQGSSLREIQRYLSETWKTISTRIEYMVQMGNSWVDFKNCVGSIRKWFWRIVGRVHPKTIQNLIQDHVDGVSYLKLHLSFLTFICGRACPAFHISAKGLAFGFHGLSDS